MSLHDCDDPDCPDNQPSKAIDWFVYCVVGVVFGALMVLLVLELMS